MLWLRVRNIVKKNTCIGAEKKAKKWKNFKCAKAKKKPKMFRLNILSKGTL